MSLEFSSKTAAWFSLVRRNDVNAHHVQFTVYFLVSFPDYNHYGLGTKLPSMWQKFILHRRSVLSAALLQKYVLLIGSYNAVGAVRIAPAALKVSHRSCSSTVPLKTKASL